MKRKKAPATKKSAGKKAPAAKAAVVPAWTVPDAPAWAPQPKVAPRVKVPKDAAWNNLQKIKHIVVLMLENRSFDHMVGYLSLHGGRKDVDGLANGMSNPDSKGKPHPIRALQTPAFVFDPCHGARCVDRQLSWGSQGYVVDFERAHPGADPGLIMGYYKAADVPVFDFLARDFTLCNRWFSSIPGQTFPNRLYALCGRAAGSRDNRWVPVYSEASFVRHLDAGGVSWGWYVHDFNTLRLVDARYRLADSSNMHWFSEFATHAANGKLASVSWIDPNFTIASADDANDDHPPADIRDGQRLVAAVYDAVANGPAWNQTLLVVTYDEHGGFFDHVTPTAHPPDDEFQRYGARVPAFIVSPWAKAGHATDSTDPNLVFDHTSIIKTILTRFCYDPITGTIPSMTPRADAAQHLGALLDGPKQGPPNPPPVPLWPKSAQLSKLRGRLAAAGQPRNELEAELLRAAAEVPIHP